MRELYDSEKLVLRKALRDYIRREKDDEVVKHICVSLIDLCAQRRLAVVDYPTAS